MKITYVQDRFANQVGNVADGHSVKCEFGHSRKALEVVFVLFAEIPISTSNISYRNMSSVMSKIHSLNIILCH